MRRAAWTAEEAAHLAGCADCRDEWELVRAVKRLEARAPAVDAEAIAAAVQRRLATERATRRRGRVDLGGRLAAAAVAAIAFAVTSRGVPRREPARRSRLETEPLVPLPELDGLETAQLDTLLQAIDAAPPAAPALESTTLGDDDGCRAGADPRPPGRADADVSCSRSCCSAVRPGRSWRRIPAPPQRAQLRERMEHASPSGSSEELGLTDEQAPSSSEVAKENGSRRRELRVRERALTRCPGRTAPRRRAADQDSVARLTRDLLDLRVEVRGELPRRDERSSPSSTPVQRARLLVMRERLIHRVHEMRGDRRGFRQHGHDR